ncbi:major facilitator superfamily domain-containing protein [Pelagophyceae sp. CCMP2097]|nr:major facilitator superfamily domain-containing protein [Pelagophyceae sp. CCMP2097]
MRRRGDFESNYTRALPEPWARRLVDYGRLKGLVASDLEQFDAALADEIEGAVLFALSKLGDVAASLLDGQANLRTLALVLRYIELTFVAARRILSKRDHYVATGALEAQPRAAEGACYTALAADPRLPRAVSFFGVGATTFKHRPRALDGLEALEKPWLAILAAAERAGRPDSGGALLRAAAERAGDRALAAKKALHSVTLRKMFTVDVDAALADAAFCDAEDFPVEDAELRPCVRPRRPRGEFRRSVGLWCQHGGVFLYAASVYTIAPTAIHYCHALGAHSAYASVLLGASQLASLGSSLTCARLNEKCGYKVPLVVGSLTCCVANLLYASVPMLFPTSVEGSERHLTAGLALAVLARALLGFGSTEPVNRAYLAKVPPAALRIAQAARFVSAQALGQGTGPLTSAYFGTTLASWHKSPGSIFTRLTAGPVVFGALFGLHALLLLFFFEDPPAAAALRQRPAQARSPARPTNRDESDDDDEGKTYDNAGGRQPLRAAFAGIVVLEFARECLLASTATMCLQAFNWKSKRAGALLGALCFLTIPAAAALERASARVDDRVLFTTSLYVTLAGSVAMVSWPALKSPIPLYVAASCVVFVGSAAMESSSMALVAALSSSDAGLVVTLLGVVGTTLGDMHVFAAVTVFSDEGWFDASSLNTFIWLPAAFLLMLTGGFAHRTFSTHASTKGTTLAER